MMLWGESMKTLVNKHLFLCFAPILLAAVFVFVAPLFSRQAPSESKSQVSAHALAIECTFSDGSMITFGQKALGAANASGDSAWRTGPYAATALRVSERMVIPPVDSPLEIPAGSYTVFVVDKGNPPWTLIVSKKTGEWGMPYPGPQYDLGRARLGSDVQPPVESFVIGCKNYKDTGGPIILWMQSGRQVAYAKILAANTKDGTTELLVH